MMRITGAFSSLGINERARSKENSPGNKFPKNGSTISLPNMVLTERPAVSPKLIRPVCDEDGEHPVDFSKKYPETKSKSTFKSVVKSYNNSFTMYAETDLDQPTDYSLRYAEDDSDSDRCVKPKTEPTEFVQDTVKTYCTEDTPYETPFNFSTSTSMSDLRIDEKTHDKINKSANITVITKEAPREPKSEFSSGLMSPEKPVNYCEEGTPGYFSRVPSCGSLNSILNDPPKEKPTLQTDVKKELTIKKPSKVAETKAVKFEEVVNYAEETPLMFSRSSSLASLDSIEQHSIHDDRSSVVSDFSRLTSGVVSPSELPDSPSQTVPPSPRPRKTVMMFPPPKKETDSIPKTVPNVPKCSVFEDVVTKFKVESTPLHFSSTTSLSSLMGDEVDGKEEPHEVLSKPDGQENINLDLNNDLSESSEDEDILAACINIGMKSNRYSQSKTKSPPPNNSPPAYKFSSHSLLADSLQKTDVTSDSLRTYCTEGTPALLSHAGSNSDLSILSMHLNEKKDTLEAEKRDLCDLNGISDTQNHKKPDVLSTQSPFSCLSENGSDDSDDALLEECILAGMPKNKVSPKLETAQSLKDETGDTDFSDEETDILENCIKFGMESNRYTQSKFKKPLPSDDTVKRYCTEDTPAILSHAGSSSNLSVLSAQDNGATNYFSDLNSNISDDDDDKLLEECVKYGMAAISAKVKHENVRTARNSTDGAKKNRNTVKIAPSDDASLSFSDDSFDADQILLQQCIKAGMPKRAPQTDSSDLTSVEKTLLQQCILEGMKKCRSAPSKPEDDASELTEAEQALLRQCIIAGMPKNKNLSQGGPSRSRESAELTESERLLLQQCIIAGMPKNRAGKQWVKKSKEVEKSEHTCCVHCPRNRGKGKGHAKGKKKSRERSSQVRESRDVNIVYVTNQIVAVKKEVVDRTHGNWV